MSYRHYCFWGHFPFVPPPEPSEYKLFAPHMHVQYFYIIIYHVVKRICNWGAHNVLGRWKGHKRKRSVFGYANNFKAIAGGLSECLEVLAKSKKKHLRAHGSQSSCQRRLAQKLWKQSPTRRILESSCQGVAWSASTDMKAVERIQRKTNGYVEISTKIPKSLKS